MYFLPSKNGEKDATTGLFLCFLSIYGGNGVLSYWLGYVGVLWRSLVLITLNIWWAWKCWGLLYKTLFQGSGGRKCLFLLHTSLIANCFVVRQNLSG